MQFHLLFDQVSFSFETASSLLFEELTLDFPPGWTGIVGANGSGKTTLLSLATGRLVPTSGHLRIPKNVVYCPQRTDDPPERFIEFLTGPDTEAYAIAAELGIEEDWAREWHRLSHGERKRSQIAVALWQSPSILAIDEPTNHIDRVARDLLESSLSYYRGIGLLVSHDRDLLDSLSSRCVFIEPPRAEMRSGGYTQAQAERNREFDAARDKRECLERAHRNLEQEFRRRRVEASRSHALRSKRGIPIKDHDARCRKNHARLRRKENKPGQLMNQLKGRLKNLETRRDAITVRREHNLGIWVNAAPARQPVLLDIGQGRLPLDGQRALQYPRLTIDRTDRIALEGPNGGGKTMLVRRLIRSMAWPRDHLLYLAQEVSEEESERILCRIRALPRKELGMIMGTVNRLGSRPERLLESERPSPGEVRKLLIADGIHRNPWLIIMDEPTNHLDLPSIECLENALKECPCALLLVSHDRRFLGSLTTSRWTIENREIPALSVT